MVGGSRAKEHPYEYLLASAMAATLNYPLWRASAIGQSGFRVTSSAVNGTLLSGPRMNIPPSLAPYLHAFAPPYKGMLATILGMTWARAAIFWGSDHGKEVLQNAYPNIQPVVSTLVPPLFISIGIQCVNQPIVRASITLQNPESKIPNIRKSIQYIYSEHGVRGLWHGTSAGVMKTVPKYCTAILVKDYMESILPPADILSPNYKSDVLWRSACKSAIAGVAGAALTNPLDVIRNEMFKTNKPFLETVNLLHCELGMTFLTRGIGKNLVAVSLPLASTLFLTDALIQLSSDDG